jgi:hypothetical protein
MNIRYDEHTENEFSLYFAEIVEHKLDGGLSGGRLGFVQVDTGLLSAD